MCAVIEHIDPRTRLADVFEAHLFRDLDYQCLHEAQDSAKDLYDLVTAKVPIVTKSIEHVLMGAIL